MVSENTEPVQAPLPESDSGADTFAPPPDNPILAEVDRLNNAPEVTTDAPTEPTTETQVPQTTVPTEPVATQIPETPLTNQPSVPPQPQLTPEQLAQLQRDQEQYQQVQLTAQLQQESTKYQQQLEAQGYLPEQAQQLAYQFMQTRQAQVSMLRQHDQEKAEIAGKQAAAEHFAQKYNLNFSDLATLKLAERPEQMESVAKQIQSDRKVRDELTELRKAKVPAQNFDNSQGSPEVASSDGNWLDRYNAGDRSPNAVAAAKKILGY